MSQTYQVLKAFISSPSDVALERDIAQDVVRRVSNSCKGALGVSLEVLRWEDLTPETPDLSDQQIQHVINQKVKECHIFILILFKRYGTVAPGHKKANTEREVEQALDMLLKRRRIMFLSYFRDLPEDSDPGTQEKKVRQLRDSLSRKNVFYRRYSTPEQFKDDLTHDLYKTVLNYRLSTSKHKALSTFWQLGMIDQHTNPRLAVIYPPVTREFMRQEDPDKFWCVRLVPHMVFEDFKALQKLEKSLRLIGFRDFKFYNTANVPADLSDINRVWVCVPRNERAQQQLAFYEARRRFKFAPRSGRSEARLYWRTSVRSRSWVEICSPLSKYLQEQRKNDPGGDWTAQKGKVIAKDFAVISRFSDPTNAGIMAYGSLKDYFIAGIRGLGTWGAAWFIDRRYDAFRAYQDEEDQDIQMLLEVTYRDERIFEVRDVSDKPKSYFEKANDIREVRKKIAEYRLPAGLERANAGHAAARAGRK